MPSVRKKIELQLEATEECPYGEGKVNGEACMWRCNRWMNHHLGLGFN